MHTGCRSRRARVVALGGAAALAALAGGGVAGTAQAAWLNAGSVSGIGSGTSVLTAGAGVATLSGLGVDSALSGATHAPGGAAFGAPFPIADGMEEANAPIGAGGAIASSGPSSPLVRRLHADGRLSAATPLGDAESTIVGNPAVASGGAAIALVADADQQVQVWRQASEGAAFTPLGGAIAADATLAAIAPTGPDSFVVVFSEPRVPTGSHIRALRVTGTSVSAPRTIESQPDGDETSFETLQVSGTIAAFVYAGPDGAVLRTANVDTSVDGSTVTGPLGEDDGFYDTSLLPLPGGGAAVAWSQSAGDGTIAGYGLVGADGSRFCSTAEPFVAATVVDRGGPLLVGLGEDGTVATVPVAGDCAPGTPAPGPNLGAGDTLAAGVDDDGALIVGVSSTAEQPPFDSKTALAVDDVTAPTLDDVRLPAVTEAGKPFAAHARAADAWGVGTIAWSVDGERVATGADATLPALSEGSHVVRATVENAAGIESGRQGTVVAVPAGAPTDSTPAPTEPTATRVPSPPAAPVAASSAPKDTTAPKVSGLKVTAGLVRPLATGHKGGATLRLTLSEDARVRVTLLRGKPKPGGKSRCTAWVGPATGAAKSKKSGQLSQLVKDVRGGSVSLSLSGRFADGTRLPRGRYRISVRASDRAGNLSAIKYTWMTLC